MPSGPYGRNSGRIVQRRPRTWIPASNQCSALPFNGTDEPARRTICLRYKICTRIRQLSSKLLNSKCGSPAWIRTTIHGSKGRCPTIRRPGISRRELQHQCNIRAVIRSNPLEWGEWVRAFTSFRDSACFFSAWVFSLRWSAGCRILRAGAA